MNRLAMGAVVAAGAAGAWWFATRSGGAAADMAGDTRERTATVERRDLGATVLATGVVRPKVGAEVRVGSRASGVLERLYVTVGDRVRRGQLLAQLDSTEFFARYVLAQATLETMVAERDYARLEFDRAQRLRDSSFIPETEYALAQRARDVTAAQVRQAEASLESAAIQLSYTRVIAPLPGVVASVSTQVGETVAASFAAPTFVTIIDLDRLEVWAYVDETDIGRVEVGQPATFTVDTYPDTEFRGTVSAIRPSAEIQDAVVNYITIIEITDTFDKTLRPEMTTTVNIALEVRPDVLAIPNGAVRRDREGAYAYVFNERREPVRRAITIGYRGREYAEIVGGLQVGEEVVVGAVETQR